MKVFPALWVLPFLLISNLVYSQKSDRDDKPPKGFVAITFGPSFVSGEFGKSEWDDEEAGFAKNGYTYSVFEFGFKFVPNFGLAGSVKGAVIPVNVQALADGYASEYGGQFTVKSTRWGYTGLFVGPFLCLPTKVVDIDFRLLTGLMFAVSPETSVSRDNQMALQGSGLGSSFALQFGLGARIHLTKRFSLVTHGEYHVSNPSFEIETVDTNGSYEVGVYSQLITLFNCSFGVAYRMF